MLKGISLGIGITLGFIIVVLFLIALYFLVTFLYKYSMQRDFSAELFRIYHSELLRQERFEEISEINKIIASFEKKERPKELLQKYKVDVDSYFYWEPTYDGGERLVFRHDKRIIKKQAFLHNPKPNG